MASDWCLVKRLRAGSANGIAKHSNLGVNGCPISILGI